MATEILSPHDCLRPQSLYDPFYTPKPFPNRRRSRPVRTNQATSFSSSSSSSSSSPKPKQGRPIPNRPNQKSSSPSPSTSPLSSSPPSTSPVSTFPPQDGFRLLKRGQALPTAQPGSKKGSPVPVESKQKPKRQEQEVSPTKTPTTRFDKTPPRKKTQSDRAKPELTATLAKPIRVGSDIESIFAGPNFAICAPEASSLPQPLYLLRSSSAGPTSDDDDDEASRTLRSLLKLQCL